MFYQTLILSSGTDIFNDKCQFLRLLPHGYFNIQWFNGIVTGKALQKRNTKVRK